MKKVSIKKCSSVRQWLKAFAGKGLKLENSLLYFHVLNCPKCQQRLMAVKKVDHAIMMIKSQTHSADLLANANKKAVGVLKHSLRENPKAGKLKEAMPKPSVINIFSAVNHKLVNTAACLVIFFLMKTNVINSMEDFQNSGDKIVSNYYEKNLGEDLARELEKM